MEPEKDIFEQWEDERLSQNWFKRSIENISIWWGNNCRFLPQNIKTGIMNIWYWLPIIWKDRNWDSYYIFNIFSHKLKAQSKYIGERDIHTRAKRDAEVMMTCVHLIEKVKDEYYGLEYMNYHKNKHWFEPCEDKPGTSTWKSKELEENFDDYFAKYPLIYKRVINGEGVIKRDGREGNKQLIAMNIAYINHDRARKLLFKIMEQNIEGWWD
jgi:hypothetical protein